MELASITLLPHMRFTLPFILMALALWFSWRVVNLPSFADFLIATEAELNKVSWTTRKRLFQDTTVVLVTLVLMALLLFGMDQVWLHLLSWKRVGVIYQEDTQSQQSTKGERPLWWPCVAGRRKRQGLCQDCDRTQTESASYRGCRPPRPRGSECELPP